MRQAGQVDSSQAPPLKSLSGEVAHVRGTCLVSIRRGGKHVQALVIISQPVLCTEAPPREAFVKSHAIRPAAAKVSTHAAAVMGRVRKPTLQSLFPPVVGQLPVFHRKGAPVLDIITPKLIRFVGSDSSECQNVFFQNVVFTQTVVRVSVVSRSRQLEHVTHRRRFHELQLVVAGDGPELMLRHSFVPDVAKPRPWGFMFFSQPGVHAISRIRHARKSLSHFR